MIDQYLPLVIAWLPIVVTLSSHSRAKLNHQLPLPCRPELPVAWLLLSEPPKWRRQRGPKTSLRWSTSRRRHNTYPLVPKRQAISRRGVNSLFRWGCSTKSGLLTGRYMCMYVYKYMLYFICMYYAYILRICGRILQDLDLLRYHSSHVQQLQFVEWREGLVRRASREICNAVEVGYFCHRGYPCQVDRRMFPWHLVAASWSGKLFQV